MTCAPDFDVTALVAAIDKAITDRIAMADGSPWWSSKRAAAYAGCSQKAIYNAVSTGRLRAARLNSRRDLRHRRDWLDAWLENSAPVEVRR